MKGLLLKDYYMLLKYCRPYALIVLIFGVCSLADGGNLFMLAYPAVLCGINSVSLVAYDEKSRWQQYCETMPYTRKQVVDSKYLMSFLLIAEFDYPDTRHDHCRDEGWRIPDSLL